MKAAAFVALGVEALDFFLQAGFALVGELAVELVLAGVDGEAGMGGEVVGEELLDVGVPGGGFGGFGGTGGASGTRRQAGRSW